MKKQIRSLLTDVRSVANCVTVNTMGVKTTKRIIVIESDDWGSIRMPTLEVQNGLLQIDSEVLRHPFFHFDSIARGDDLSALFEILQSIKNAYGQSPVITFNTAVANPDFEKIAAAGYEIYAYECFLDTLKRYAPNEDIFSYWQDGMRYGLIRPQYHCREHLNVNRWMRAVREIKTGNSLMRAAFERGMISLPKMKNPQNANTFMDSFNFDDMAECKELDNIFRSGAAVFERIFGYKSNSFIASCYIWDTHLEETMNQCSVKYIQGERYQRKPIAGVEGTAQFERIRHGLGDRNHLGQTYLVRNVHFEPSLSTDRKWVKQALNGIAIAFQMKKPAVISSHRLNYIGAIHEENRRNNLEMLKMLLEQVVMRWPDVVFMSSDQLGAYLELEER